VRRRAAGRLPRLLAVLLAAGVLAGCGSDGYQPRGPFRPRPEGAPPEVGPPSDTAPAPAPRPPGERTEPGSGQQQGDPNVVADDLTVPTGLVVLPDGSAIVGERDTGRLLQVFPDRSPARELMTVPGVDTSGDGGLLGLALSPTYPQDGLLYAYLSTATDNRVVRFPLGGTPNPVFTGIPRGEEHNGGALLFGPEGHLWVGTGDTGNPALAQDIDSLAGKVLRIDVFGRPVGSRPVFSRGHRDVTALCLGPDATLYATDASSPGPDEVDAIVKDGDYGSPEETDQSVDPVLEVPAPEAGLAGCTVGGRTMFLGALDGERIHVVKIEDDGRVAEEPEEVLRGQYGRLRTVVLDAQGGLWITTSNRDGVGTPRDGDDKVLRIVPPTAEGNSPL
jgi:glucose/arabinose dehydrogenase